jgi:hypothetical protein
MGMTDYDTEAYDLLVGDSEEISDSNSSRGSHHPSRECFMAGAERGNTLEGHVASVREGNVTSPADFDDEDEGEEDARVLPHLWMDRLRARQQELEDARLQLERECVVLECEITRHANGGCARAIACDMNRRIVEDDDDLPHFARASQNIAVAAALLQGLSEPATPENRRAQFEFHTLLECATVQQVESSISR